MQVAVVIKGDPNTLKAALDALIVVNTIVLVHKTGFAGSFLVVYDDSGTTGQTTEVVRGTPMDLADELGTLTSGGSVINVVEKTFAAGFYIVVYT